MKSTTATAKAMTDAELMKHSAELRKQIPAAQALLNAIKREQLRRLRPKAKDA